MKYFIKTMKALSDPNRVKIVKMLQRREMCVCEIREALGLAQSTVSKHLKVLEDANLISFYKEGLWVNYTLNDSVSGKYAASLLDDLKQWLEDDPEVVELVERLPDIRREDICRR